MSLKERCRQFTSMGSDEPAWVTVYRTLYLKRNDLPPPKAPDQKSEFQESPGIPLTPGTLEALPPGRYDFVQLEGEPFLRVASADTVKHLGLSARRKAFVAGELLITINFQRQKTVEDFSLQSGTFLHEAKARFYVPLALWDQGIFPEAIRVYSSSQEMIERGPDPMLNLSGVPN